MPRFDELGCLTPESTAELANYISQARRVHAALADCPGVAWDLSVKPLLP